MSKAVKISAGVVLGAATMAALLWFFAPAILGVFYSDAGAVDDSDLSMESVQINQQENTYSDFRQLAQVASTTVPDSVDTNALLATSSEATQAEIQDAVAQYQKAQTVFGDIAQKSVFQDPSYASLSALKEQFLSTRQPGQSSQLISLGPVRDVARANQLQARLALSRGSTTEAVRLAADNITVGRLFLDTQGPLIYNLVGVSIVGVGANTIEQILESGQSLSAENRRQMQDVLSPLPTRGFVAAFQIQYQNAAIAYNALEKDGAKALFPERADQFERGLAGGDPTQSDFYFQPNKNLQLLAEYHRSIIKRVKSNCGTFAISGDKITNYGTMPRSLMVRFTPNAVGKILLATTFAEMGGSVDSFCETNNRLRELRKQV